MAGWIQYEMDGYAERMRCPFACMADALVKCQVRTKVCDIVYSHKEVLVTELRARELI